MNFTLRIISTVGIILFLSISLTAQRAEMELEDNSSKLKFRAVAELGYLAVLDHKIQFSNSGTEIDYVKDGGQDVLFPFRRFSLELELNRRNIFTFLYQPLQLKTQALLNRDLIIDDLTYPQGIGVDFLYDFPFYRTSYMRELMLDNEKYSLALGLTLQIRTTTITFESQDGTLFRRNANVGIVPALKLRTSAHLSERTYLELEVDGIYAPISYLNGSDNEITGAILDASLRLGYKLTDSVSTYFNLRYLGGGAVGTDPDSVGPGDGYVKNWLHFLTLSSGFVYEF